MNQTYKTYVSSIEKHFVKYLDFMYEDYKRHPKHKYILSDIYKPSEALLEENREKFEKHVEPFVDIHSKGNFKSSQLLAFDMFLPYYHDLRELKTKFWLDENITHIEFEKVFSDYTHVDVFMLNQKNEKIICEVKFTEKAFDYVSIGNQERTKKFNDMYHKINDYMLGEPVSEAEFLSNYQLYRNLYHAMSDEHGNPGYMIVIYPKRHLLLENQFNRFYNQLKNVHQFKHIEKVKKTYIERMSYSDTFWNKYIVTSSKIIEFKTIDFDDIEEHTVIDVIYASKDDLVCVNKVLENKDQVNVLYDWEHQTIMDLWKSLESKFGNTYQLIHKINQKHKNFEVIKTITAYYKMNHKK